MFFKTTKFLQQKHNKNNDKTDDELSQIMQQAEEYYGLPPKILSAIGHTESNFTHYIIRFNHKIYKFKTIEEAKDFLANIAHCHQKHNIDIGCMQINNQHARFFSNLTSILNPKENIWFAAKLLAYNITYAKSIKKAISIYNKGKFGTLHNCSYLKKVLGYWHSIRGVDDIELYIDKVKKCYAINNEKIIYKNHCSLFFDNKSKNEQKDHYKTGQNSALTQGKNIIQARSVILLPFHIKVQDLS